MQWRICTTYIDVLDRVWVYSSEKNDIKVVAQLNSQRVI
jgi:hypothetical protein